MYIRCINKILLYSTGNYIQYPVIRHNGKEYKKECMYKCSNHFSVQQKLINHCKSTITNQLFVTPWTVAHQAPLSMGFFRQESWSGLAFPSPGDVPDQGLNPCFLWLLHCRQILYPLRHLGSPPFIQYPVIKQNGKEYEKECI